MKLLTRITPRLVVRPIESKDYSVWRQANLTMLRPQNIWDLGPIPQRKLTQSGFRKMLRGQTERRKKDTFYSLGVFDKAGTLVGGVSIMEVARGISQTAFLGYRIFNRYWGKGYAKESVRAVIEIGFEDIKLHRIEAGIEPKNLRSIRLAKSLGMRREGLKKRALFLRKTWVDLIMFTVTTEDGGRKFNTRNFKLKNRS